MKPRARRVRPKRRPTIRAQPASRAAALPPRTRRRARKHRPSPRPWTDHTEALIQTIREPIVVLDDRLRVLRGNRAFYQFFRLDPQRTEGQRLYDLSQGRWDDESLRHLLEERLVRETRVQDVLLDHEFPVIGRKLLRVNACRLASAARSWMTVLALEDTTAHRRTEEDLIASEIRYRRLFETAKDGIVLVDAETGTITDANPFATKLLGYSRQELVGHRPWELASFQVIGITLAALQTIQEQGFLRYDSLPLTTKDGREIVIEFVSHVFLARNKKVIQCNIRDITTRKRAEEAAHQAVLLKEIHHRVKNNLQVISSLLSLQLGHIKNEQALELFRESQNRVKAMAMIHEILYQSKDLARIELVRYLRSLTDNLFRSYGVRPDVIRLVLEIDEGFLGVDTAIPCGLIINELVSNALKYAFPAGRRGQVRIGLRTQEEPRRFTLVVQDDGVGFPQGVDFRNTESLGLRLVNTLTEQLGGTIELDSNGGTTFTIAFADLKYKDQPECSPIGNR